MKHPGERSLKSYRSLLVVNSGNYYLDRLTSDVYEGNITYDVFNHISYINYNAIFIFKNVLTYKKCNRFSLFFFHIVSLHNLKKNSQIFL